MSNYDRYGTPVKKRKNHSAFFAPLVFLLVVGIIVFALGIFFRVQTIEVRGGISYTDEEIINASGIDIGDNLFFINRFSASSRIFSKLAFVEEATIDRSLPNTVVITVQESYAAAYVDWEGQCWMISEDGKLLGSGTEEELAGLIHVLNLTPLAPKSGEILSVAEEDELKLSYLLELLPAMSLEGMLGDVTDLDFSNAADPTFRYLDRFTVKMGTSGDSDYKLRMLLGAVDQLEPGYTGTIDLSDGSKVYVTPD